MWLHVVAALVRDQPVAMQRFNPVQNTKKCKIILPLCKIRVRSCSAINNSETGDLTLHVCKKKSTMFDVAYSYCQMRQIIFIFLVMISTLF